MFLSGIRSAAIVNNWQGPDESNTRPRKRCRLDPKDEGTNSAGLSGFLSESPKFALSATHHVGVQDESWIPHERNVLRTLELGPASLPPRYRRQWTKQNEPAVDPRNDIRTSSPNHLSSRRGIQPTDVIDLTIDDTDTEGDSMALAGHLNDDKRETYEDSSSETDSESGDSAPEIIPFVSKPTGSDSAMTLDLEHLNATARGVMNNVHASNQGIKRNHATPRRNRLAKPARHTPEGVHVVSVPKSAYNTARRVLVPESLQLPLVSVSMRADMQFFHRANKYRLSKYSLPNEDGYRHVVDATMISETAILAYGAGPTQISVLHLIEGHRPSLEDLMLQPHTRIFEPNKRGATITCLSPHTSSTSGKTIRFFTGGYDKAIRLWSVNPNLPHGCTSTEPFKTSTIPEALAFRGSRRSVFIATSKKLLEVDIDHLTKKPACILTSNAIYQIHVHKEVENITILEVDSRDHQIHLYDDRSKSGFDRTSDCYFGRRGRTTKHSRGDTRGSLFARGYDDGMVCVWDLRNAKKPILRKTYHHLGSVIHTTFLNMDLICYGKSGLTFLDISEESC